MSSRVGEVYKKGELEVILSLAPTKTNIQRLSELLDRSEDAIEFVYKIAFGIWNLDRKGGIQVKKILAAKKRVGIEIGRKRVSK